jgi:hypothetical protein
MNFDPCFPFDAGQVDRILRQAATVQVIGLHSRMQWKEVDNTVLDTLYGLKWAVTLGNSANPGFVESSYTPGVQLRRQIEVQAEKLWKAFLQHFATGAGAAKDFIDRQSAGIKRSVRELDRLRIEAKGVNQQVDQLLQEALFWLHTTKFTAEIALNILGIIPGGGLVGFVVRTGIGLGYPVGVELINNWENASLAKVSLLAFLGAVKTNIASILTEDQTMGKAELKLVKDPVKQAQAKAAFQKGLRKVGGGSSRGVKAANARLGTVKGNSAAAGFGLKTFATALTGVSCYFAVTGSIQSGEAYQEALESL